MTDQEILTKLGLSDADATGLIRAISSLNTQQKRLLLCLTDDPDEAADTLGLECTADDLQRFLAARGGPVPANGEIYFGQCAREEDDEE